MAERTRERPRKALFLNTDGGANPADAPGTNINTIVANYRKTGTVPNVALTNPLYGDFTFPEDIHSIREAILGAKDRFDQLPAEVRTLCDNDWVQFTEKFDNLEQRALLQEAGLKLNTDLPTPPTPQPPDSTLTPPPGTPTPPVPTNTPPPTPDPTP